MCNMPTRFRHEKRGPVRMKRLEYVGDDALPQTVTGLLLPEPTASA